METLQRQTERTDHVRSAFVERGIQVQESVSTVCAIEYLKSHNIHPQIIERVLLQPEQRRRS